MCIFLLMDKSGEICRFSQKRNPTRRLFVNTTSLSCLGPIYDLRLQYEVMSLAPTENVNL